ncbi:MAG: aminoglycoside nucleotidyltransferase [Acidobacteriia bacterium]|nr:aminoglycoside nucleotidyltransferase [Terriglobia bacterium]
MQQQEVIDFYNTMRDRRITLWIDGGWGVDALLERQTRPHKDLDVAIQQKDVAKLRQILETEHYRDVKLEDARPHNFVLADNSGREIDVHVIVLDGTGNGIYGLAENGEMYPAASLVGVGAIGGCPVRCISPEWMVRFHSGYELKEKDYQDVSALCERFGIDLPKEYLKWVR